MAQVIPRISTVAGWWAVSAACALAAGPFAAPSDGPLPFRRDRVPLDVETMTGLSRDLKVLAQAMPREQPGQRRAVAQSLALALALDPVNREARELLSDLQKEGEPAPADGGDAGKSKDHLWKILAWLESPDAGTDAQGLAICLGDVAASLDPGHEGAEERHSKGDLGAWRGWVPELASYEPKPKHDPTRAPAAAILRNEAKVFTPLWVYDEGAKKVFLRSAPVAMKAWAEGGEDHRDFKIQLENTQNQEALSKTSESLTTALKAMGDNFPHGGRISLNTGGDYIVSRNHQAISAAATVLTDAAVSGREPAATVLGIVGADGKLKLPPQAWDKLRALSDGPGGRLVVPREAEPLLVSFLAMDDAAFFMKYEVVLAGNVKELIDRSEKAGKGTVAEVAERFAEIRTKQGTMPLGQYVANHFIRQRLGEISQAFPDHLSAKLLDMQGAGKRPTWLPRPLLASEIRRASEVVGRIAKEDVNELRVDQIERAMEGCRTKLDALDRLTEMRDREMGARGKDLLPLLRKLAAARRTKDENDGWQRLQNAFSAYKSAYENFRRDLDTVIGDAEPVDPQDEKRDNNKQDGK